MEQTTLVERNGIPAAISSTRALARRCLLHQCFGHILLPVQCAGWGEPLYRALGDPGVDERARGRNYSSTRSGEVSQCQAAHHLGQRPAVPREGLQGIHSHLRHDACENVALLSTIEREDRTLAQIHQSGMHPAWRAFIAGGCPAGRGFLDRSLQYGSASQCDRLSCADGQTGRPCRSNLRRTGSQVGGSSLKAATAPARISTANDLWNGRIGYSKLSAPSEAEAGSAGTQPCRGIARWAHRHDEHGTRGFDFASRSNSSDDRPSCLKNPIRKCPLPYCSFSGSSGALHVPRCRLYLTKDGFSPFHAEPRHGEAVSISAQTGLPLANVQAQERKEAPDSYRGVFCGSLFSCKFHMDHVKFTCRTSYFFSRSSRSLSGLTAFLTP